MKSWNPTSKYVSDRSWHRSLSLWEVEYKSSRSFERKRLRTLHCCMTSFKHEWRGTSHTQQLAYKTSELYVTISGRSSSPPLLLGPLFYNKMLLLIYLKMELFLFFFILVSESSKKYWNSSIIWQHSSMVLLTRWLPLEF